METTGNVGERRFRGTEEAVGGKAMEAASEAPVLRGGIGHHLFNISPCSPQSCTVLGKQSVFLRNCGSTGETNHGLMK